MIFNQKRDVIGVYSSGDNAAIAFDHLILAGFSLNKVILVGQDSTQRPHSHIGEITGIQRPQPHIGEITGTATGLKKGLFFGNILGGTTGLLLGLGILALPGVGQIALMNAIAFTLLSGGVCTAAGGIIGVLIGLGLTSTQVTMYAQRVSLGQFLLILEGTKEEIFRAQQLLNHQKISKLN